MLPGGSSGGDGGMDAGNPWLEFRRTEKRAVATCRSSDSASDAPDATRTSPPDGRLAGAFGATDSSPGVLRCIGGNTIPDAEDERRRVSLVEMVPSLAKDGVFGSRASRAVANAAWSPVRAGEAVLDADRASASSRSGVWTREACGRSSRQACRAIWNPFLTILDTALWSTSRIFCSRCGPSKECSTAWESALDHCTRRGRR